MLEGARITISQTAAKHKKVEQSQRLPAIDVALIMPALFLCAQKRRGVEEEGEERRREESRQIKWSEKCPHERELAPSSSGGEEEIPLSAVELGFHTKTKREINSP